jgi:uncharacterized protein YcbX
MQLDQIWQYPVKSMRGSTITHGALADNGVVGDRMWALRDDERGAIASARRLKSLSRLEASFDGDSNGVAIRLPDGSTVRDSDADVNARISAALDHQVSLCAKEPISNLDHYRRGRPDSDDMMVELRSIFGRLDNEPLPDLSIFPPEMLEFEYPPGNYFDCYPLMIMSTSALAALREALPNSAIDERRFRPSLVIDTGDAEGHPEFEWVGRRIAIGGAEVQILSGCPRCATIANEFAPELPRDSSVLRHVVRDLDQNVGVYATVVRTGPISIGDSVEFV